MNDNHAPEKGLTHSINRIFDRITQGKKLLILFLLLAVVLLSLGFHRNQWQTARPKKFSSFEKIAESYIMARLVISRQSGLFSYGGLAGWGDVEIEHYADFDDAVFSYQYDKYLDNSSFTTYWAKGSHPGFQGIFFSALDWLSPFPPSTNLSLFRMLASGLFALTLTGIVLWFYLEFGWLSAIFVLVSCITSQWIILFGRNLFFFSWVFFFPMLMLLFRLREEKDGKVLSSKGLFWLAFGLVLFKCLFNGYDFILPVLGMVASPIVFYGLLNKWDKDKFIKRLLVVILASLLAVFASLVILTIQSLFATGSLQAGLDFVFQTIARRTYRFDANSDVSIDPADMVSIWTILDIYLSETYLAWYHISFSTIIILFAVISLVYLLSGRRRTDNTMQFSKGYALTGVLWFSILSPLSWYIIFKSLAYYHTQMNYLPWHMPFTIFGFGMCGFVIERIGALVSKELARNSQ